MTHPVVQKASQMLLVGDIAGAERSLALIADEEGDNALVAVLDEISPADLMSVMRGFDGSKETVVNLLVTPEQFARAIVQEQKYRDATHETLRAVVNAVIHRDSEDTGEFLEAVAATADGRSALADYFSDRLEEVTRFAQTGSFAEEGYREQHDVGTIAWLNEKIEELDQALYGDNPLSDSEPKVTRSEVADADWMETAWVLWNEQPDIFEEVLGLMKSRLSAQMALADEAASTAGSNPARGLEESEEEAAI